MELLNHLKLQETIPLFWSLRALGTHTVLTHMQAIHSYTENKNNKQSENRKESKSLQHIEQLDQFQGPLGTNLNAPS